MKGSMDIARESYLNARKNIHKKASQIQKRVKSLSKK
jgi:hypothetical protein